MQVSATLVDNLPGCFKSQEYESEVKENKLNFIKMTQRDVCDIDRDSRYKIKGLKSSLAPKSNVSNVKRT